RRRFELSPAGRLLLAVLSGAAGVIHLAMVPSHWGSSTVEGVGFALVGWSQIAIAVMLLAAPSRRLLRAIIVLNAFAIGAWVVSRMSGLPFGAHAWQPRDAHFVDVACVGIEVALVLLAAEWHSRPALGRNWSGARLAVFAVVPISVLALATAALASASARNLDDGSNSGQGTTIAAGVAAASSAGHVHTTTAATGATTGAAEVVDLNGAHVHGVKAQDVAAETQPDQPLDPATRALLAQQLTTARDTALRYPTVADALAAGYHLIGGFGPGAGAHYLGGSRGTFTGQFDPSSPQSLIYDGTSPTSQVVGLMYTGGAATAPEGFAGPNDHWHRHSGVCLRGADVLFPVDANVTEATCSAAGGRYMATTTWMVHAWVVPSWESPSGVFSHENPNLRCADGTFNTDTVGRCQGT
ncbi:MAG: hypothetical protein ACHQIG_13360, partial [Acidimicrobiia bacterium]